MASRFARYLLLFAALCLPVQAMAGLSMSLCRDAQERATQPEAMPCHEAMAQEQAPNHDAGCDNCEMCHIAGAGFIPSTALTAGLLPAGRHYVMPAVPAPPSHIAEPPQHPPRATA
jgi:hypothetical protein